MIYVYFLSPNPHKLTKLYAFDKMCKWDRFGIIIIIHA